MPRTTSLLTFCRSSRLFTKSPSLGLTPEDQVIRAYSVDSSRPVLSSQITHLDISRRMEDLESILPHWLCLPNLNTFALVLKTHKPTSDSDARAILVDTLIPFLLTHQSTIQNISLDFAEKSITASHAICPLLNQISRFSRLQSFAVVACSLSMAGCNDLSAGLHEILTAHQGTLRFLSVAFQKPVGETYKPSSMAYFSSPWCKVRLPKVRSLTVDLKSVAFEDAVAPGVPVRDYLFQFARTLTALDMRSPLLCWRSYLDLETLTRDCLAHLPHLASFKLTMYSLNSETLPMLAKDLPMLRTLELTFDYVQTAAICPVVSMNVDDVTVAKYATEFHSALLVHTDVLFKWALESLDLVATYGRHSRSAAGLLEPSLGDCLPNLAFFCGWEPDQYLATRQQEGRNAKEGMVEWS